MGTEQSSRTPRSLADDLRLRTPGQIRQLLAHRPDLLNPWPTDISQLARRAADDASVLEAMGTLSTPTLRVLEVYAALHEATADRVAQHLDEDVDAVMTDLWERALLWGGPTFKIVRAAQQAFGPYPCGLAAAGHLSPDPASVREAALALDPDRLRYLVWEHPVSTTPNALTVARAERSVVPREVALILRDGRFLPAANPPAPPEPAQAPAQPWTVLAGVRYLLTDLVREPLAWHPQRGVARRTLQDRATAMAVPLDELLAWLELAGVAGLVGGHEAFAVATADGLAWLRSHPQAMWRSVIVAWLDSDRPLLACRPDELGSLTTAGIARTAMHRRQVLAVCPPAMLTPNVLEELLAWELPRMVQAAAQIPDFLAELTALGLLVAGVAAAGLADPAVIEVPDCDNALIIQPDHTVISPANVDGPTWELLHDIARLESWGPVTMHRIDPSRLRLAMAVRSPEEVLTQLGAASRTPLPQSLEYTVRDAARGRPVQVRQETVIRSPQEDAEALRALGWPEISTGVFSTPEAPHVVRRALAGLGIAVTGVERPHNGLALEYPRSTTHDGAALDRLVEHLVEVPRAAGDPPVLLPVEPGTLREALAAGRVWLEFSVGEQTLTHLVEPLETRSGSLTGWSLSAARTITVPLSRIAALRIVDD